MNDEWDNKNKNKNKNKNTLPIADFAFIGT